MNKNIVVAIFALFLASIACGDSDSAAPTNEPVAGTVPASQPTEAGEQTLSLAAIRAAKDEMTEARWEAYKGDLVGDRVENWSGEVTEVAFGDISGEYTILVDLPDGGFGFDVVIAVPEDVALLYDKDETIQFSADIDRINDILGITVYLKNAEITVIN